MVQYMSQAASSIRVKQNGDPGYLGKRLKQENLWDEESASVCTRDFASARLRAFSGVRSHFVRFVIIDELPYSCRGGAIRWQWQTVQ